MNIKISHNMLQEFLDTDATPAQIQEYVSLSGPNIETVEKIGNDFVYDIEVTSNRVDAASVFGFAQECAAILPRYDKIALLKKNLFEHRTLPTFDAASSLPLDIKITGDNLASRVMAIVFSDIVIGQSAAHVKSRLEACGERSINNVVDISNYVRIMLGHPIHLFDYDKIKGHAMTIRLSKKGENIILLDKSDFTLPGDDIVIEDGEGYIIDLAGIMGAANSEIDEDSKRVVLFVPTFTGHYIRQTSMKIGQRTNAVAYFEKNVDPERALPTLAASATLLASECKGAAASPVIDLYSAKRKAQTVEASVAYINKVMAVRLTSDEIKNLIQPLGFECANTSEDVLKFTVPSYRAEDVTSQADILEEVARIYGYHHIPNAVQVGEAIFQPVAQQSLFSNLSIIRQYLRAQGFNEQYNYSMVSDSLLTNFELNPQDHLHLANPLSDDNEYMRTLLVPSLVKNISDNKGAQQEFNFFECARIYKKKLPAMNLPQDMPVYEEERIGFATTQNYSFLKGILENIFSLLKIDQAIFEPEEVLTTITIGDSTVGYIGPTKRSILSEHMNIDVSVITAELYLQKLLEHVRSFTKYVDRAKFARIKLDLTYTSCKEKLFGNLKSQAQKASKHLLSLSVLSAYRDKVTVRMEFGYPDHNMTEKEALIEFEKIKKIFED